MSKPALAVMHQQVKAVGLLSGGLDSTLAVKLMMDQGVDVTAFNYEAPFCQCGGGGSEAVGAATRLGLPLHVETGGEEYLRMLRNPRHGYGSGMNPCIDCRILMLKRAKRFAQKIGANFIFTGEVLGQRPMSQHQEALRIVEKESGLEGKILRPLSAKLLPPTEAELKGWVNREQLLNIRGRSRRAQMDLAENLGINEYPCPAGGCLLTEKEFVPKLQDLFSHNRRISLRDAALLRVGRHFRLGSNKIVVGRDESENMVLSGLDEGKFTYLEVPDCGSPLTLLQGRLTKKALVAAARLTARYSDTREERATVHYRRGSASGKLDVDKMTDEEASSLRISRTRKNSD